MKWLLNLFRPTQAKPEAKVEEADYIWENDALALYNRLVYQFQGKLDNEVWRVAEDRVKNVPCKATVEDVLQAFRNVIKEAKESVT